MKTFKILAVFGILVGVQVVAQEPTDLAAVLTVRYGAVTLQRSQTAEPLPIRVDAEMPFGIGDTVRTDDSGRVYLDFGVVGEILVLPASQVTLEAFATTSDGYILHLKIEGVVVQRLNPIQLDYALTATDFVVTQAGSLSAVWSLPEQFDTFAVAQGQGAVRELATDYRVADGQAFWGDPDQPTTVTLGIPNNAAVLEAHLLGCSATVKTAGEVGVLVRRGIGQFNERLGLIRDGSAVSAMAMNNAGYWVRIQYRSGFSWIVEDALEMDCPDLKRLDDNTPPERISSVMNPLDSEIALLEPFFQTPLEDTFFYQYR